MATMKKDTPIMDKKDIPDHVEKLVEKFPEGNYSAILFARTGQYISISGYAPKSCEPLLGEMAHSAADMIQSQIKDTLKHDCEHCSSDQVVN
jgi:predicted RNA-binding Zn ribbon-like protein